MAFLLAPGLAALAMDRGRGKPMARAMLLLGAATAVPSLISVWRFGGTLTVAMAELGNPAVIGVAWLSGAVGWLLDQFAPTLVLFTLNARAVAQTARLNAERARIIAAWDLESEPEEKLPPGDHAAAGNIS